MGGVASSEDALIGSDVVSCDIPQCFWNGVCFVRRGGPRGSQHMTYAKPLTWKVATAGESYSDDYLSGGAGCVTTACRWCQKQPPRPMAGPRIMAIATRMGLLAGRLG